MIRTSPRSIRGNWYHGWVLDMHTVPGPRLSDGSFPRTELGEALFRFKYRNDRTQLERLAEVVADFISGLSRHLAAIVPVPPSDETRASQPVLLLCEDLASRIGVPSRTDLLVKVRATAPRKNVGEGDSRIDDLRGAFQAPSTELRGRWVLLVDDIFDRGETLTAATEALYSQGNVERVYVLTLTRTRFRT